MTPEQEQRYARNIEKGRPYANLFINEDFLKFKAEAFDERLINLLVAIVSLDPTKDEDIRQMADYVSRFQELQAATDTMPKQKVKAMDIAQQTINKIRKEVKEKE